MNEQDNAEIQARLDRNGMRRSGDYRPAEPMPDGRWSVDPSTLLLLLDSFGRKQ